MTTTPEREPLALTDIDDLLAYIPHALGFQPSQAAVLVLIANRKLEATLRIDLPTKLDSVDHHQWTGQVAKLLERLPHIHHVAVVFYCTEQNEPGTGPRRLGDELYDALEARLAHSNISVLHSWCVTQEHLWDYSDPIWFEPGSRPDHELNEAHLSMVVAGSAPLRTPWDGLGIPPWDNAEQVAKKAESAEPTILTGLARWAEVLDMSASKAVHYLHGDPDCAADLLASLRFKLVRDILPFLAGTSQDEAARLVTCLDQDTAEEEWFDALELTDYLLGKGPRSPRWARTDQLFIVAKELLGVAQGTNRSALMCILAWIEWARGRGSLSNTLLEQVLREDAEYNLAVLFKQMLNYGHMPVWATNRELAWRTNYER